MKVQAAQAMTTGFLLKLRRPVGRAVFLKSDELKTKT
jgi:hypothetical protein